MTGHLVQHDCQLIHLLGVCEAVIGEFDRALSHVNK